MFGIMKPSCAQGRARPTHTGISAQFLTYHSKCLSRSVKVAVILAYHKQNQRDNAIELDGNYRELMWDNSLMCVKTSYNSN
jgi:hypothetical protein